MAPDRKSDREKPVQQYQLNLTKRATKDKKARRASLEADKVLANIYGVEEKSVAAEGDYREIYKVIKAAGKNHPIVLKIGEKEVEALVHEVEQDTITQRLHHITFRAFKRGEKIKAEVPVHLIGDSPAVKLGLIIVKVTDALTVETIPSKIPEAFDVDLEILEEEGQDVRVSDLELDDDIVVMEDENTLLVRVEMPRAQVEEEPEEDEELEGEEGETAEGEEADQDDKESSEEEK